MSEVTQSQVTQALKDAGFIIGRIEMARAVMPLIERAQAEAWDEGHEAGVWNSAQVRQSQSERRNPYGGTDV